METTSLIPAAEYVRMSTEEQPNSILLQQAAIQQYAAAHGYQVVVTYADPGRSGIEIKHRAGLRQLIQDVVCGQSRFRAILVYDVSRWGRFQDTDESAHYEFLCRSAGVPVHYCAEQFENNGMLPNEIMKALKRTMAAEYSRELAAKVLAGQRWVVRHGFRVGGPPGYGLRRMLVSTDGRRKQILESHERKNLKSDRVILVLGPRHEVEVIRTIFALAAEGKQSPRQIADELNRKRIKYIDDKCWTKLNVYHVLKNEKYMGSNVWGKTNKPFSKFTRKVPRSAWITKDNAFVPIVSAEQFARVQKLIQTRNNKIRKPDSYFLKEMRRVLAREGKLSQKLLKKRGLFDHRAYISRFGSTMRAYELVGYTPSAHARKSTDGWRKLQTLRAHLLSGLCELFPSQLRIIQRPLQSCRRAVELDNHLQVSVQICRPLTPTLRGPRWVLLRNPKEGDLISLICLTDKSLGGFTGFYVVPEVGSVMKRYKVLREGHPFLAAGRRLESLSQFYEAVKEVLEGRNLQNDIAIVGDTVFRERASRATIAGREIELSAIETAIFKLLLQNAGSVVRREKLWSLTTKPSEWFLRAHISALRKKLGPKFRKRIVTVVGAGYMYQKVFGPAGEEAS
jgi:DNA invertase Pin-like site-specific DNA recombinase/DNA-binding winged helix-turn-helix (wHTH) protein